MKKSTAKKITAASKAVQQKAEAKIKEKEEKERLEKEATEKAEKERLEKEATEKAEKERLEKEAAEKEAKKAEKNFKSISVYKTDAELISKFAENEKKSISVVFQKLVSGLNEKDILMVIRTPELAEKIKKAVQLAKTSATPPKTEEDFINEILDVYLKSKNA